MRRALHFGLLLMALLGLIGQSTAIAMAPTRGSPAPMHDSMQTSMTDMDCIDVANEHGPGKAPCKKVTLQCMAAMGCSTLAVTLPPVSAAGSLPPHRNINALPSAARLQGRSYGPEPDPPSFLI